MFLKKTNIKDLALYHIFFSENPQRVRGLFVINKYSEHIDSLSVGLFLSKEKENVTKVALYM